MSDRDNKEIEVKKASEIPLPKEQNEPEEVGFLTIPSPEVVQTEVKIPHPSGKIPNQRCGATSTTTGSQCKRICQPGFTVCAMHGGSAPQVIAKAKQRLAALAEPAVAIYQRVLQSDDAPCALCGRGFITPMKMRAAQTIMDRSGLGPTLKLEHSGEIAHEHLVQNMTDEEIETIDEIMERVMARVEAEEKQKESDGGD